MSLQKAWLWGVAAAGLLLACTSYGTRPACPSQGGPAWMQVDSPHFRVLSDLPSFDAETTARELEVGLSALTTAVGFAHPRSTVERTTVVVFQDESEFHAFAPRMVDGSFTSRLPNDLEPAAFVLTSDRLTQASRIAFFHEITHDLFARNFGWSPPWLNEGWAQYYSTLRVEGDRIVFGGPLLDVTFTDESAPYVGGQSDGIPILAIPTTLVPAASALIHADAASFYPWARGGRPTEDEVERAQLFYVGSWALVHMLLDGSADYTQRFRAFLQAAQRERIEVAWNRAFDDAALAELDRAFRRYLARGELAVWTVRYDAGAKPLRVSRRRMRDDEVHLLWARLVPWSDREAASTVQKDLDEALVSAPEPAEVRYWRGLYAESQGHLSTAAAELSRAVDAAPAEPRFLLALLALRAEQRKSDVAPWLDRLSAVASSATQLRVLAEAYGQLGQTDRAFDFARRAANLSPIDPAVLDTYAALLFGRGEVDQAVRMQRSAVAFLPEGARAPALIEHLRTYEAHARLDRTHPR